MASTYTANLNLIQPEVGGSFDSWGGTIGLNESLRLLDAVFQNDGLSIVGPIAPGLPGVGLRIGVGKTLNVEGQVQIKDSTDVTKVAVLNSSLISTATTRVFAFPDESGTFITREHALPTGTIFSGYYGGTAPAGFVRLIGTSIGDAASGATERAHADTFNLFTRFWQLGFAPSGGYGATVQADFDAHKRITLPDHRGRVMAAIDAFGSTILSGAGVSTNRGGMLGQSAATYGIPATIVNVGTWHSGGTYSAGGYTSGAQSVNIVSGNQSDMQSGVAFGGGGTFSGIHTHNINGNTGGEALSVAINSFGANGATTASNTSSGTNAQPTITVDVIIAL